MSENNTIRGRSPLDDLYDAIELLTSMNDEYIRECRGMERVIRDQMEVYENISQWQSKGIEPINIKYDYGFYDECKLSLAWDDWGVPDEQRKVWKEMILEKFKAETY